MPAFSPKESDVPLDRTRPPTEGDLPSHRREVCPRGANASPSESPHLYTNGKKRSSGFLKKETALILAVGDDDDRELRPRFGEGRFPGMEVHSRGRIRAGQDEAEIARRGIHPGLDQGD